MKYSCVGEEGKVEEGEGKKGREGRGGTREGEKIRHICQGSVVTLGTVASRLKPEGYGHQINRCDVIDLPH